MLAPSRSMQYLEVGIRTKSFCYIPKPHHQVQRTDVHCARIFYRDRRASFTTSAFDLPSCQRLSSLDGVKGIFAFRPQLVCLSCAQAAQHHCWLRGLSVPDVSMEKEICYVRVCADLGGMAASALVARMRSAHRVLHIRNAIHTFIRRFSRSLSRLVVSCGSLWGLFFRELMDPCRSVDAIVSLRPCTQISRHPGRPNFCY